MPGYTFSEWVGNLTWNKSVCKLIFFNDQFVNLFVFNDQFTNEFFFKNQFANVFFRPNSQLNNSQLQNVKRKTRERKQLKIALEKCNEELILTWHWNITLKTTKEIFIKYWSDFLYSSSDDVTIISEKTNWVIFYRHFEVVNIWKRIKFNQ